MCPSSHVQLEAACVSEALRNEHMSLQGPTGPGVDRLSNVSRCPGKVGQQAAMCVHVLVGEDRCSQSVGEGRPPGITAPRQRRRTKA